MDRIIEGWGQSLKETADDLARKAQAYIDREGLREAPTRELAYA